MKIMLRGFGVCGGGEETPRTSCCRTCSKIKKSSLAQQSEFLRSLKGTVSCDAEHVKPEPGCEALDVCRLEGPQETQKMAEKIIADKHQHRLKY